MRRIRQFRILATGNQNYNNKFKLYKIIDQLVEKIDQPIKFATYNRKLGVEKLIYRYCMKKQLPIRYFDVNMIPKNVKRNVAYYSNLDNSVKWCDLILIFSDTYTKQIKNIIQLAERKEKDFLIIKE